MAQIGLWRGVGMVGAIERRWSALSATSTTSDQILGFLGRLQEIRDIAGAQGFQSAAMHVGESMMFERQSLYR